MVFVPKPIEEKLSEIEPDVTPLVEAASHYYVTIDLGHDWLHVMRVAGLALWIGEANQADLSVLLPAVLFHDAVNIAKDDPRRLEAGALSADVAASELDTRGYPSSLRDRITTVIREHSYTLNLSPSSIESAILQDADKLDALGAIGIARTVICGVRMGSDLYNPDDPFCETRTPNDQQHMIDHFYGKHLAIETRMNTELAKEEAQRRLRHMRLFLDQLKSELPDAHGRDDTLNRDLIATLKESSTFVERSIGEV